MAIIDSPGYNFAYDFGLAANVLGMVPSKDR